MTWLVVYFKARPNARNISTRHRATLLDRVVRCCEGAGQTRIFGCCNKNLTIFKLDPTPSNILQHVATGWLTACNTFRATVLQDVALKMLRAFGRAFTAHIRDSIKIS